ncbi:MAG: DMT family transporter [Pseudomonadota bacterium]
MLRLIGLVAVVLCAFAANSILNRLALTGDDAGPVGFAAVRVTSGAVALLIIARFAGQPLAFRSRKRVVSSAGLLLYLLGFSFAYLMLDAGLGALILFGGVQVIMFATAVAVGEQPPLLRWFGMGIGLVGLVWLLAPGGDDDVPVWGTLLMCVAAVGWAAYTLVGRGAVAPIGETASAFLAAAPVALFAWVLSGEGLGLTATGWALAMTSGVVTSGMGYALWYALLPQMDTTIAGLAQLLVPVIAVVAGGVLLSEVVTLAMVLAGGLVLAGVALGTLSGRAAPAGRR